MENPDSSSVERHHLQLDISHKAWMGWRRYKSQFKNANEAFEALAEVRMNEPPGQLVAGQVRR